MLNLPYYDQWWVTATIAKAFEGKFSFSDLISLHNDSIKFFPRLIFIALAYLTKYDIRYESLLSFLMACIISFNLYRLSQITALNKETSIASQKTKSLLLIFGANLLIFSPIQYEAWLNGLSSVVFISLACITTCINVIYSQFKLKTKFLICVCLSTISTFSFANGALCWLVCLPIFAFSKSWYDLSRKKWLIVGLLFSFAANIAIYYHYSHNYFKSYHFSLSKLLVEQKQEVLYYFLSFLGNPLAWGTSLGSLTLAQNVGTVLLLLLILSFVYLLKLIRDTDLSYRMLGWLMLGIYAVVSAALAMFGRLKYYSVDQSLSSRYTTFSLYLAVSLIYLAAIIVDDFKKRGLLKYSSCFIRTIQSLATVCITLHLFTSIYAVEQMSNTNQARLQQKTCLLFINVAPDKECIERFYVGDVYSGQRLANGIDGLKPIANSINKLGWLNPPLLESRKVQDLHKSSQKDDNNYGYFDAVSKLGERQFIASGWGILPDRKEPAHSVIVTYDNDNGDSIMFKAFEVGDERRDVAKFFNNDAYSHSGWHGTFSSALVPTGSVKVNAWAFDTNTGKAAKLNSSHLIQNDL